jgi:hypothetical protein
MRRRRLLLNAVFVVQVMVRSLPTGRPLVVGLKDEPFLIREDYSVRIAQFCGYAPRVDD